MLTFLTQLKGTNLLLHNGKILTIRHPTSDIRHPSLDTIFTVLCMYVRPVFVTVVENPLEILKNILVIDRTPKMAKLRE